MPTSLRQRLNELASSFANNVLDAIRSASIDDLLAESGGRRLPVGRGIGASVNGRAPAPRGPRGSGGRLPRRSSGDIAQVIDRIVAAVRQSPKGLRAEEIRQRLGMQAKELPRPLKEAVQAGKLGKSGQKRATTYFVRGSGAGAPSPRLVAAARAAKRAAGASKARGKRAAKKK